MLRAAVVGIGNMGKHHARIYSELENAELVAVCDMNETLGKEISEKYGCKYYKSHADLIASEKLDVVTIAVPTTFHRTVALDFINKKINVLLEKPICNTVADAEELVSAAKRNEVILAIGHIERYNPAILRLKEMIDDGSLGEVISINANRVGIYPPQIKDSDVVVDVAIHDVDILNFLFGRVPDKVYSNKGIAIGTNKSDYVDILMNYGKGNASVHCNWITPVKIRNLSVTGTKGYAELNYITQEIKLFETEVIKTFDNFGDFVIKLGNPRTVDVAVEKGEPLKLEVQNFLDAVKNTAKLKITPREAIDALKIVLGI